MVAILKAGLEVKVKEELTRVLMKDPLAEYERTLRTTIEPIVESLSFKYIEQIRDFQALREELRVFIKWEGKEAVTKEYK
jgi:hypothetical protein